MFYGCGPLLRGKPHSGSSAECLTRGSDMLKGEKDTIDACLQATINADSLKKEL